MGRIRVLDEPLINRIAAGEVVERPASALKELVENSIDAGGRAIGVEIASGGRQRIEVSDDGLGMDRDDAVLCLERHATSKLRAVRDLDAIATLGFRGEALSSIAAVSMLRIETATEDGSGTEVEVQAGTIRRVREIGRSRGTTIRVERLFYNVPARRKFLRSEATESGHVLRWLTRYGLACPDRGFRLDQAGRRLIDLVPARDEGERIAQIHGRTFAERLLPFRAEAGGIHVHGFAGRPVDTQPRPDAQHFVVNGRAVQDRVLRHAVAQAYGNTMPHGRHPVLFLFLRLTPDAVDVNVHPQKTEVRFRSSSEVHDLVRDTVAAALSQVRAVPSFAHLRPAASPAAVTTESVLGYAAPAPRSPAAAEPRPSPKLGPTPGQSLASSPIAVPLAQLRDSYIVAEDAEGLVLVDQHAAHERVLFERLLAQAEEGEVETQALLFPVSVELAPHEAAVLETELGEFQRLGFRMESFGPTTFRVDGIPAATAGLDPTELVRELLGEAESARAAKSGLAELRHRLVTTAACKAAIKIRRSLSVAEMQQLLDDLFRADNPTTCPHGRPVLFRMSLSEIERAFRRR